MSSEIPVFVSTDELQKAADAYLAEYADENWKVTVSDKTESHLDKLWVVCEDRIISGYGMNHKPEKSYYAFIVKDGRLVVEDTMSDEALQDLLGN